MGIQHWHSILCLRGNKSNIKNTYCRAYLSVRGTIRKPIVEYIIKSIHEIFA